MFRLRKNAKSLNIKLTKFNEELEGALKDKLLLVAADLAEQVVKFTDTGAYASSFSVDSAGGRSIRRVSSFGRPGGQSGEEYRGVALADMTADINSIDLEDPKVLFKNGAPHALVVETKYQVFGSTRDRFNK